MNDIYLVNEKKYSHLHVSLMYAVIQLVINALTIFIIIPSSNGALFSIVILILLSFIYTIKKKSIIESLIIK